MAPFRRTLEMITDRAREILDSQNQIFKRFNPETDLILTQKTIKAELFDPDKAIIKPWTSANGFETSSVEVNAEESAFHVPVKYVGNVGSSFYYFSYMRATSSSISGSAGEGAAYQYMKSLAFGTSADAYRVDDDTTSAIVTSMDVIAVARQFYRDGFDPNFFGVFIHNAAAIHSTDPASVSSGGGVIGLFPSSKQFNSNIGIRYYLYPTTSGDVLYDEASDTFTMKTSDSLDLSNPLGEVFIDTGVVVLFKNRIKTTYVNVTDTDLLNYFVGLGGNSILYSNTRIFYCRALNNEFNFSTNRSFYDDSNPNVIREEFRNNPVTFITTVGLYNNKNELIAVGKSSQAVEKNFQEEVIIRAELANY